MNKGLEALKRIRQETAPNTYNKDFDKEKCCEIIEKELKALDIIRNELPVNVFIIRNSVDYDHYIEFSDDNLSKEQYELLKEVLIDE